MDLNLYPKQIEPIQASEFEVLIAGDGGGKSHALRAAAMMFCGSYPGINVCLLHPREDELAHEHVEGANGFKALLFGAEASVQFSSSGVSFGKGSKLFWLGADQPGSLARIRELMPQVLLLDEIHRLPRDLYENLLAAVKLSGGRVIATSVDFAGAGWVAERFALSAPGRRVVRVSRSDLPESLAVKAALPTLDEFISDLGVPFLAAGSPYRRKDYVKKVIETLQRFFWNEFSRFLLLMPTQYGKTLLAIRCFAAYVVYCRQAETVAISTYAQDKSRERNRDARDFYERAGGRLKRGGRKQDYWQTPYGGGAWAVGIGGGSGNPMNYGFIDDPDADLKESKSATKIVAKDDWYQYVWLGRGAIETTKKELSLLTVSTRMWFNDTVARNLRLHAERGERVHVLPLSALYDPRVGEYYERFAPGVITVEPDYRTEENEPIDSERHPLEHWEKTRKTKPHIFAARDQQMPLDASAGTTFSMTYPMDLRKDPGYASDQDERYAWIRLCRVYDIAHTEGAGNWTATVKMGIFRANQRVVIRHASRARYGPRNFVRFVAVHWLLDGPDTIIVMPEDPAAGRQTIERVRSYLGRLARWLMVNCEKCAPAQGEKGSGCESCTDGVNFVRSPKIRVVGVRTQDDDFEDFAAMAAPISDSVEGNLDFVRDEWRPTLAEAVPWFTRAIRANEGEAVAELRAIAAMAPKVIAESARYWVEFLPELHQYPNADPDDWISATSYAWQFVSAKRSMYPGATERLERGKPK